MRITWYNYGQETGDTRLAIDNFRVNRSSSAAATAVDNMIAALPAQITVSNEAAIVAAREAYTALTENQKTYVTLEVGTSGSKTVYNLRRIKLWN